MLLVVMVALTVFLIFSSLLTNTGTVLDQKSRRLEQVRNSAAAKQQENKKPTLKELKERFRKRQEEKLLSQQKKNSLTESKNKVLQEELQIAQLPLSTVQFTAVRLASGMVLAVLAAAFLKNAFPQQRLYYLMIAGGFILGMILPRKLLESKIKKQQDVLRDSLPDIMDLLVVSVEAGLGFDAALIRLHEKDQSPMMEELMRAQQDIHHGMTKKEAYTNLSNRCKVKEITSFVNAMIQADQLGISIRSVLKAQAESLREERRQRAEEKALKAPVTMMVPLVIFIFPVIFIVLLGPAVMNIMEIL